MDTSRIYRQVAAQLVPLSVCCKKIARLRHLVASRSTIDHDAADPLLKTPNLIYLASLRHVDLDWILGVTSRVMGSKPEDSSHSQRASLLQLSQIDSSVVAKSAKLKCSWFDFDAAKKSDQAMLWSHSSSQV